MKLSICEWSCLRDYTLQNTAICNNVQLRYLRDELAHVMELRACQLVRWRVFVFFDC